MRDEEMNRVLRILTGLSFCLNSLIDSDQHKGISMDEVVAAIENQTIFQYLAKFKDMAWGISPLSKEDKLHLIDEWQRIANAYDAERKFGVNNNGISLLLAYVIEGIQMRTFSNDVW